MTATGVLAGSGKAESKATALRLRFRLTVSRLLVIVVAAGLCLAAYRLHVSLGSLAFGVLSLSLLRTFGKLDRPGDVAVRPSTAIGIFAGSMVVAAAIIGVSFLTFAGVYFLAFDSNSGFPYLVFGMIGLGLVRMADAFFRLWEAGTLGDRRIVRETIVRSLKTPLVCGVAILLLVIVYPAQSTRWRSPLDSETILLSVILTTPVARRMRRWLW